MKERTVNANLKKRMLVVLSIIFWIGAAWGGLTLLSSVTAIQGNSQHYSENGVLVLQASVIPVMVAVEISVCVFGILLVRNARKRLVQVTDPEMSHSTI